MKRKRSLETRQRLLHAACALGDAAAVSRYLDQLGPALLLSAVDSEGRTPLHVAARAGHENVCDVLLRSELLERLDARSNDGSTALFLATAEEHAELCAWLLERGADASIVGRNDCDCDDMGLSDLLDRVKRRRGRQQQQPKKPNVSSSASSAAAAGLTPVDWDERVRAAAFDDHRDGGYGGSSTAAFGFESSGGESRPWTAAAAAARAQMRSRQQQQQQQQQQRGGSGSSERDARPDADPARPSVPPRRAAAAPTPAAAAAAPTPPPTASELRAIRAGDDAAWVSFAAAAAAAGAPRIASLDSIPWPRGPGSNPMAFDLALSGAARKKAVRQLQRRWHADKFLQNFRRSFATDELRNAALLRANEVMQVINNL